MPPTAFTSPTTIRAAKTRPRSVARSWPPRPALSRSATAADAIATAIAELGPGDVLVIAGKGHETGQIVGGETVPFDDAEIAREIAELRPHGLRRTDR